MQGVTRRRYWQYRDLVLEFDIKGLFDNISHELLLKAAWKHVTCKRALLYIEKVAHCSHGAQLLASSERVVLRKWVLSALQQNLFLHYAFDYWMKRTV